MAAAATVVTLVGCGEPKKDQPQIGPLANAEPPSAPYRVAGFIGDRPGEPGGRFLQPSDVAVFEGDPDREDDDLIFVAEGLARNSRIQRLDANGNFEVAWGRDAVRDGSVGGHEICREASRCKAAPAGDGPGELNRPSGLAVNPRTADVYAVDAGNRRVQQFARDGSVIREWALDVSGSSDGFDDAAIAISPSLPHDVFVADGASNRVLQYTGEGAFVRAWGWGVAENSDHFQTCEDENRCRAGKAPAKSMRRPGLPRWPGEIAVDREGVVYGSVFFGRLFDSDDLRTRILRFRSEPEPEEGDAEGQLLRPLIRTDPTGWRLPSRSDITNGTTLGLDLDSQKGRLFAINNPFGVSKMDVIHRPAGEGGDGERPRTTVADRLPFLQNVNGLAVADAGRLVYLASGVERQSLGRSTYTGCTDPNAKADCHGLVVLARGGRPEALVLATPSLAHGRVTAIALVNPRGVARYRFETSRDGRTWSRFGQYRYAIGTRYERVTPPDDLSPPYRIRLRLSKKEESRSLTVLSNELAVMRPRTE